MKGATAALIFLSMLATGCGAHRDNGTSTDVESSTLPLRCSGSSITPMPLAEVAANVGVSMVGPCGQLAYVDASNDLHLLDSSFTTEILRLTEGSPTAFSPDGAFFMATTPSGVVVHDFTRGVTLRPAATAGGFLAWSPNWSVALPGNSPRNIPFVCAGAGAGLLVDDQVRIIFPDLPNCASARWSPWGIVVDASKSTFTSVAANFADGQVRTIDLPHFKSTDSIHAVDLTYVSADGRVLIRHPAYQQTCGDTSCGTVTGFLSIFDLTGATPEQTVPASYRTGRYLALDVAERGPHTKTRLALNDGGSMVAVFGDEKVVTRVHSGLTALMFVPEHDEILARDWSRQTLVLVPFLEGPIVDVAPDAWLDLSPVLSFSAFVASRDGNIIACPTVAGTDHSIVSGLPVNGVFDTGVWFRSDSSLHHLYGTQPLQVVWVGTNGATLVSGPLVETPPTDAASVPVAGVPGLHLLDRNGVVLRRWATSVAQQVTDVDEGFLLSEYDSATGVARLSRVNATTGALLEIDQAPAPLGDPLALPHQVDGQRQRIVYRKISFEGTTLAHPTSLHAGPLP